MFLQKLILPALLVFIIVHSVRCLPVKTPPPKHDEIHSNVIVNYDEELDNQKRYPKSNDVNYGKVMKQKEVKVTQSFMNQKQYPKSNDINYGKVMKQRVAKVASFREMSNVIYDGQHVVDLIAKAKATKNKHTIKEHELMLEKSAAESGSGSLVDIDVFRRLLHLQAMKRDGKNLNNVGQPLIDNTIDILNRMKLGSQYPKLAFEILDGQSLLDIMSKYQLHQKQPSPKKSTNKSKHSKILQTNKAKPTLTNTNAPKDNEILSVVKANRQKSKSAVSDPFPGLHSIDGDKKSKLGSPNGKTLQYPIDHSENTIVDYAIGRPMKTGRNLLDADNTEPSVVNIIPDQSQNDTGIQSLLPEEPNNLGEVYRTGNQEATITDTKQTIIDGASKDLTTTPVDTSLAGVDPTIIGNTDLLLQSEIETFIQNATELMGGQLTTQLEAPTDMESSTAPAASPTTVSALLLEILRSNNAESSIAVTEQATKFPSSPTTEQNLTTNKVTTEVASDFDWCNFLCNVMKRCSPACSGHITSWNR